jgi:hypothetical protein
MSIEVRTRNQPCRFPACRENDQARRFPATPQSLEPPNKTDTFTGFTFDSNKSVPGAESGGRQHVVVIEIDASLIGLA